MTADESLEVWLQEPTTSDPTFARRGEHTLDWLTRSTNSRAQSCRRFLNHNIAKLPDEARRSIQQNARNRWQSAFFELIVARVLQELGADIQVEMPTKSGSRPDFTAHFKDAVIIVEAVSPIFNGGVGDEARNQIPLLEYIESTTPVGWRIGVVELPRIRPSDSKKQFELAVRHLMEKLGAATLSERIELEQSILSGKIRLIAFRSTEDSPRVLWEPAIVAFDDSKERIRYVLKRKKKQVRHSEKPVILALEASGLFTDLEDLDMALYGHTFARYNREMQIEETGFTTDGVFTRNPDTPSLYAGVLVFTDVGFLGGPAPILYRNPRHTGALPVNILQLEQRYYDSLTNSVRSTVSTLTNIMAGLEFVTKQK